MVSEIEFAYLHTSHYSRLRRTFSAAISIPAVISVICFAIPVTGRGTYWVLLDAYVPLQYVVGWTLASMSALVWLLRYLRYGVTSPFYSFFRLLSPWRTRQYYYATNSEVSEASAGSNSNTPAQPAEQETGFAPLINRITGELSALGRRNTSNLVFGIGLALLGVTVIGNSVFNNVGTPSSFEAFALQFTPRLSLALFIEVFAYFFLRLYKDGLAEIKYFQNELTNIESKKIALDAASICGDTNVQAKVISILAKTERNGILEKGQTTAAIQLAAMEHRSVTSALKSASTILKPTADK